MINNQYFRNTKQHLTIFKLHKRHKKNFSPNTKIDKKIRFANHQSGFGLYAPSLLKKGSLSG